jgi:hypothetical protein
MDTRENTELLKDHPDYISQITENASDAEIAVFLEGKAVTLNGAPAYPAFDEGLHWTGDVGAPDPSMPLLLTFDFNVNPMVCLVAQKPSGPSGPELRIVDAVILYGGSTVEQTCRALCEKYPEWPAGVVLYGDATGKARHVKSLKSNYVIIREVLRANGLRPVTERVPQANPPVTARLNAVNRLLKNANGVTRLWIRKTSPAKKCATRELVRSLQQTRKKDGTDDIDKPAGETHSHAADALGYLVASEFPISKPQSIATIHTDDGWQRARWGQSPRQDVGDVITDAANISAELWRISNLGGRQR